jgi:Na+-translocating ferredoxin:NAD+ oxidoreductase RNF subunit RnfB
MRDGCNIQAHEGPANELHTLCHAGCVLCGRSVDAAAVDCQRDSQELYQQVQLQLQWCTQGRLTVWAARRPSLPQG